MKLQDEKLQGEVVEEKAVEAAPAAPQENTELTEEMILQWKQEHGKIFKNIVGGQVYIWRRVKRSEYVKAMSFKSEESPDENYYLRQDIIARTVTLYPDPITMSARIEEYAGLAGEIADRAIYKSGFEASETEEL